MFMNEQQKQKIRQLAEVEIRYTFANIKAQTDKEGKSIKAYYFFLVDDFFAAGNAAITVEDMLGYKPDTTVLYAIWSGRCLLYEGKHKAADGDAYNRSDTQSPLYKEVYSLVENLDNDTRYNKIRADFEECLIEAFQNCDKAGVFGDRTESGMLIFAFYIDDYDGNSETSLLYRSAKALNNEKAYREIIEI